MVHQPHKMLKIQIKIIAQQIWINHFVIFYLSQESKITLSFFQNQADFTSCCFL